MYVSDYGLFCGVHATLHRDKPVKGLGEVSPQSGKSCEASIFKCRAALQVVAGLCYLGQAAYGLLMFEQSSQKLNSVCFLKNLNKTK